MNKVLVWLGVLILLATAAGCGVKETGGNGAKPVRIGVMLSDVGLGDQSFSDTAFYGLIKARDELGVHFDYREISEVGDYEKGIEQLVQAGNDIVVGLGFMAQESLEKVAKKYPDQQFLLIDSVSELKNVVSLTFKEDEGSFLVGALAALKSKTDKLGFIGGMDAPVIRKFAAGFEQGVKAIKPQAQVSVEYAGDFGNVEKGAAIARKMIAAGTDVIYPAAGLTGVGALKEAEASHIYAFGVDSDQYVVAEKAVVSSMLKNIDEGIYRVAKMLVQQGEIGTDHIELGLNENGVALAPIRVVTMTQQENERLEALKGDILSGKITISVN